MDNVEVQDPDADTIKKQTANVEIKEKEQEKIPEHILN